MKSSILFLADCDPFEGILWRSMKQRMHPAPQRSIFSLNCYRFIISGAMNYSVPWQENILNRSSSTSCEILKSINLICTLSASKNCIIMFSGFMSLWQTIDEWRCSMAERSCEKICCRMVFGIYCFLSIC